MVSGDQLTNREGPRGQEVRRGLLGALIAFLDAVLRWVKVTASPVLYPEDTSLTPSAAVSQNPAQTAGS